MILKKALFFTVGWLYRLTFQSIFNITGQTRSGWHVCTLATVTSWTMRGNVLRTCGILAWIVTHTPCKLLEPGTCTTASQKRAYSKSGPRGQRSDCVCVSWICRGTARTSRSWQNIVSRAVRGQKKNHGAAIHIKTGRRESITWDIGQTRK